MWFTALRRVAVALVIDFEVPVFYSYYAGIKEDNMNVTVL
jgi:hypothetical protein